MTFRCPNKAMFQSAPHFSSEANAGVSISGIRSRICFNPRLTSAARRTLSFLRLINWSIGFNPRLTSAARRTSTPNAYSFFNCSFNPRLTSAARRTKLENPNGASAKAFQSAPHFSSEANFGVSMDQEMERYSFQSAPHFSSEANSPRGPARKEYNVSILASLQQRGEQLHSLSDQAAIVVSIRASLQQRGERNIWGLIFSSPSVSIRASLHQRGERCGPSSAPYRFEFQSAPHFSSEANSTAWT